MAVLIVAGLVALFFAVRYALNKIESHTTDRPADESIEPIPCDPQFLQATVTRSGSEVGQQVGFSTEITHTGARPCYLDTEDISLRITSGDHSVFNTATCADLGSKRLLFDVGLSSTQQFTWNGINYGPECTGTNIAGAGTYVARVFFADTEILENAEVFELYAPPEPEPEAEPES